MLAAAFTIVVVIAEGWFMLHERMSVSVTVAFQTKGHRFFWFGGEKIGKRRTTWIGPRAGDEVSVDDFDVLVDDETVKEEIWKSQRDNKITEMKRTHCAIVVGVLLMYRQSALIASNLQRQEHDGSEATA